MITDNNAWCSAYTNLPNLKPIYWLKGYLRYKTIFCIKVALDVQLMNFFILRKNNASISRYYNFCIFVKSTDLKFCDVIIDIAT